METNYYNAGVYTYEELQEAIKAEREECALICENISTDKAQEFVAGLKLAEAIRAKDK